MFGLHSTPSTVEEAAAGARVGRLLLVDVREPGEVAQVAVPDARHIALGRFGRTAGELPRDRLVAFICRSGNRSATATEAALRDSIDAVNVRGGVLAWGRDRLPLEQKGAA